MNIQEIENHRIEKIDSLFSNKVDKEITKFIGALDQIPFSSEERRTIGETLDYACAINYGEGPLCKFYVTHPIRVACYTLIWQKDEEHCHADMVKAALIHNCLEKNFLSSQELQNKFGEWIRKTIATLTVDRENQYNGRWLEQYYIEVDKLGAEVQMLKALDKFDNIYALCLNSDDDIRKKYLDEIELYITPKVSQFYPTQIEYFSVLYNNALALGHKSKANFGY